MKEKIIFKALACRVIAVAVFTLKDDGSIFEWRCYIDAVPGHNHNQEYMEVAKLGDKVNYELASMIFPGYGFKEYAR